MSIATTHTKIADRRGTKPTPAKKAGKKARKPAGLQRWMLSVLDECDRAAENFSADPVHDLRVALRRCRSMADGLIAIDPDPDWKKMKKAGKRLFQRLGALRDTQVMMEWIEKLYPAETREEDKASMARAASPATAEIVDQAYDKESVEASAEPASEIKSEEIYRAETQQINPAGIPQDSPANSLRQILRVREAEQKIEARAALAEFDRKEWRQWSKTLPRRAARIRLGSALFKHLALERWTLARDLHNRALRNRSQVALHTLRIGIKRLRYIVENFLPDEHKAWSRDLKEVQDWLGEVHDLDVLWATALTCHIFPDEDSRTGWHARILEERNKREEAYRKKMVGPDSCWSVWRAGLPQGQQVRDLGLRRIQLWAKSLDPDYAHAERVSRMAVELFDGLVATKLFELPGGIDARSCLRVAALLHDVGKSEVGKGHHKASCEMIRACTAPLGWSVEDLHRAAIVARFHHGALPTGSHKLLRDLFPQDLKLTIQLAAVLRLANAFDTEHDGHIRRVKVENIPAVMKDRKRPADGLPRKIVGLAKNEALVISAEGYSASSPTAQTIAAERYLLETVLKRPVVVKAASIRVAARVLRTAS
jgi:CHAD domain-containing protein/HD superfamily phosphodiesterase